MLDKGECISGYYRLAVHNNAGWVTIQSQANIIYNKKEHVTADYIVSINYIIGSVLRGYMTIVYKVIYKYNILGVLIPYILNKMFLYLNIIIFVQFLMDKFLNSEVFLVNLDICPLNFSVGQVQTSEMNF